MSDAKVNVKVVVRCRPLNSQEKSDGREQIVHMEPKMGTCIVQPNNNEPPLSPHHLTRHVLQTLNAAALH